MSPEEKKLEKLNALFELVNQDFATPDDLIKLSEAILNIVTTEKERQAKELENAKDDVARDINAVLEILNEKERGLKNIITRLTYQSEQAVAEVDTRLSKTLSSEINRLERKIPTKTDLSGIEAEIKAIQEGLNTLPTELTINNEAIRDGLELLQGDERLDVSAIKGIDELLASIDRKEAPNSIGVKLLRYLQDVDLTGITNGQTLIWNSTLQRFLPGTASGGTGSPGGSDTQVQFNDGGSFGGDAGLTYNKTTNELTAGSFSGGASALTALNINGTNGNGHIHLKHQASDPSSQASSSTIFADSNGNLAWLNDGLSKITIDGDGVTANRSYTLPDASGTVALTVQAEDIEITDTTKGIILKSANGTRWRLGITNNGELTAVSL